MARLNETEDGKDVPQTAQVFKTPARKTAKKKHDKEFLTTPASTRMTTRNVTKVFGVELDPGIPTTTKKKRPTNIPARIKLGQIPSPVRLMEKSTTKCSTRKKPGFEEVVEGIGNLTLSELRGTKEKAKDEAEQDTQEVKGKKRTAKAKETKEVRASSDDEAPPEKKIPTRTTRAKFNATKAKKVTEEAIIEESDEDMADLQLKPIGIPASKKPTTAAAPTKRTIGRKLSRTNSTVSSTNPSPSSTDSEADSLTPLNPTWQKTRELILSFKGEAAWATNKKLWDVDDEDIEALKDCIDKLEEQNDDEAKEGRLRVFKGTSEVMQSFRAFQGSLVKHLEMVDGLGLELDWDGGEGEGSEEDESDV